MADLQEWYDLPWVKSLSQKYGATVLVVAQRVEPLLRTRAVGLEEFTDHDLGHSIRIVQRATAIVPEGHPLQPTEMQVFLLAALLHDIGMWTSKAEALSTLDDQAFRAQCDPQLLSDVEGMLGGGPRGAIAELVLQRLVARYNREKHPERVPTILLPDPDGGRGDHPCARLAEVIDDDDLLRQVCVICEAHGWERERLQTDSALRVQQLDGQHVDTRYLACLLRLSDLLDLDARRVSTMVWRYLAPLSAETEAHWRKHATLKMEVCLARQVRVSGFFDTTQGADAARSAHRLALGWLDMIREEVGCLRRICAEQEVGTDGRAERLGILDLHFDNVRLGEPITPPATTDDAGDASVDAADRDASICQPQSGGTTGRATDAPDRSTPSDHSVAQLELPALRRAQEAIAVARSSPDRKSSTRQARAFLTALASDAYWLLSSFASVEWLSKLQRNLQIIARSTNLNEVDALCTSLERMASEHQALILESGLLLELWRGDTNWHRWRTLRMMGTIGGWESPFGRSILDDILNQHPELIDQASVRLMSYANECAGRAGVVLDWYLAVMKRNADEKVPQGRIHLEWALGEVIVASGAQGLRRAYDLVEAVLGDDGDSYSGWFKVRDCTRDYGQNTTLAKLRLLLVTEIKEPSGAHCDTMAKQVIRRLLDSERQALRALAFSTLLDTAERSSDMLKVALPCPDPLVNGETQEFALRYVYNIFSTLSDELQRHVEDVLLSVPLEAEENELRGIHRLRALEAVPGACRSQRIQRAIDGLLQSNSCLRPGNEPPDDPLSDGGWLAVPLDEPELDLSAAADNRDALKGQLLSHLTGEDGSRFLERRYMVEAALMRLLAQRPELRIPVAIMISDLPTELYEVLVPGVVILQEDATLDGPAALDLARVLPDDPGSRSRQALGYVIGKHWDSVPEQRRPEGLLLLAKWAAQESDPPAGDGGKRGESAQNLLTEAINTPRGILACMLVSVAARVSDPSSVLDTITMLASDRSIPVRAAVLHYLTPLLDSAPGTAVRVVQDALADGHAVLLPFAANVLRRLDPAEMVSIGFPLLEQFILAEGKEAQEALGLLAMLWLLRTDESSQREWLMSLVRVGPDVMRQKAAHVAMYNTLGQKPDVMDRAYEITETLLAEGDVQHLAGLLHGVPMGVEGDWNKIQHAIRRSVRGGQCEVLDEAVGLLGYYGSPPKAEIVAPLLEGLIETPAAMPYVFDRLNERHTELDAIHQCLIDAGLGELALRFLDAGAACCVERLRGLIESAQLAPIE